MIDVIISRIEKVRGELAIKRLLSPALDHPSYDYGELVGTVRGLTLALEQIELLLNEQEDADDEKSASL